MSAPTEVLNHFERARGCEMPRARSVSCTRNLLPAATNAGTVVRLEHARQLLAQNQEMLARARDEKATEHATERAKLAERTRLAEQWHAAMEKRALLDIDKERTASAKLRKTLESERAECNTVQVDVGRPRTKG